MLRFDGDNSAVVVGCSGAGVFGGLAPAADRGQRRRSGISDRTNGADRRRDDIRRPRTRRARSGFARSWRPDRRERAALGRYHDGSTNDDPLPPEGPASPSSPICWPPRSPTPSLARKAAAGGRAGRASARGDTGCPGRRAGRIFAAVSVEVDRLFGLDVDTGDVAGVVRFDPGPELLVVGVSRTLEAVPLGSKWPPTDLFAPARVLHTGRSGRVDEGDLASIGGPEAEFLRNEGYLSQVASPIIVEGRLWGAISVNSRNELPHDTEERLERFTGLVAAAVANAESGEALARLADEQAALRRVATLVAEGAPPDALFRAVADEVASVIGPRR